MAYESVQAIQLPIEVFLSLEFHLMETRPDVGPDAFITGLVQRWLAIDKERLALRKNGLELLGFQWKNIFLPNGTRLRTSYYHANDFAKVIGNHIVSDDGTRLTPSRFANRHAKGRNAWRFVWLRFPGDDYWSRAVDCRTRFNDQLRKRSLS